MLLRDIFLKRGISITFFKFSWIIIGFVITYFINPYLSNILPEFNDIDIMILSYIISGIVLFPFIMYAWYFYEHLIHKKRILIDIANIIEDYYILDKDLNK